MDHLLLSLRGHAKWVRNWRSNPRFYLEPIAPADVFDHAADEIERLRAALKEIYNPESRGGMIIGGYEAAAIARRALEQSPHQEG